VIVSCFQEVKHKQLFMFVCGEAHTLSVFPLAKYNFPFLSSDFNPKYNYS
jgi:hypothetical protein